MTTAVLNPLSSSNVLHTATTHVEKSSLAHLMAQISSGQSCTPIDNRDVYAVSNWVFKTENAGQFTIGCQDGNLVCTVFTPDNRELTLYGRFASNQGQFDQMMNDVKSGNLDFFVAEENVDHKFTAYFLNDGKLHYRTFDFTAFGPKNNGDAIFKTLMGFIEDSHKYALKYATPV